MDCNLHKMHVLFPSYPMLSHPDKATRAVRGPNLGHMTMSWLLVQRRAAFSSIPFFYAFQMPHVTERGNGRTP